MIGTIMSLKKNPVDTLDKAGNIVNLGKPKDVLQPIESTPSSYDYKAI
jgi:hypothetical protein